MKTICIESLALAVMTALAITSCSEKEDVQTLSSEDTCWLPSVITIDPGNDATRSTYGFNSGSMYMYWEDGDEVYCSPAAKSGHGCMYVVPNGGAATNTFVASSTIGYSSDLHMYYYPGGEVYNDPTFMAFSYAGQVQRKSAPTAHIGQFHSIRKVIEYASYSSDYDMSHVSLAGADQSGCLKFDLSGVTFTNPTRITLEIMDGSSVVTDVMYDRNYLHSAYPDATSSETLSWPSHCSSLSIGLDGYGTETHLEAYMMHTCADMPLYAGDKLRVTVTGDVTYRAEVTIPSTTAIKGGYFSTLTIDDGWTSLSGDFTEYDWDGDVVTLQESYGSALDIVIMGDGFIKEDFDDGTYDSVMRDVYQEFFSVEPFASIEDCFNVFYVKAPSPQRLDARNTGANGAENSGNITKFSVEFTPNSTSIDGNNDLAREYARKAFSSNADERIKNALIIVVANQRCHAGTCHMQIYNNTDYGRGSSVAYVTLGSSYADMVGAIHHEAGGHGFGKLGDEYFSSSKSFNTGIWSSLEDYHSYGFYRNVDRYVTGTFNQKFGTFYDTTNDSEVLWYDLLGTSNNYESPDVESLGIFEGGFTYQYGICRPTEDGTKSIMNKNTGIFNAISRRAILYRAWRIMGDYRRDCFGSPDELESFLRWDSGYFLSSQGAAEVSAVSEAPVEHVSPLDPVLPYAEPVITFVE